MNIPETVRINPTEIPKIELHILCASVLEAVMRFYECPETSRAMRNGSRHEILTKQEEHPMHLDQRDFDLLRLIGVCKDIPADCSPIRCDMFSPARFSDLAGLGYIRKSKCGLSFRLTDKGYSMLISHSCPQKRDAFPVGDGPTLRRRLEVAKTVLSMYRRGIVPFGEIEPARYIPMCELRRRNRGQLLGTSKLCGIAYFQNQAVPAYFIKESTKLNVNVEMSAIQRVSALFRFPDENVALFFADTADVLESFESPFDFRDRRYAWGDEFAVQQNKGLFEPSATTLKEVQYA